MMSEWVASAPMCSPSSATAMYLSSLSREISTRICGSCVRVLELDQKIGAAGQNLRLAAVLGE